MFDVYIRDMCDFALFVNGDKDEELLSDAGDDVRYYVLLLHAAKQLQCLPPLTLFAKFADLFAIGSENLISATCVHAAV